MYECFSEAVAWRLDEATNLPRFRPLDVGPVGFMVGVRKVISFYYQTLVSCGLGRVEALFALRLKF